MTGRAWSAQTLRPREVEAMTTRATVRKFLARGEAITVKDNSAAEFHKENDRWVAILSTDEVDCEGDRVKGWEWEGDTIPLMAAHDHGSLPVGLVRPFIEEGKLKGELIFPAMGTTVASDEARKLVEGGVLKAVSIGFQGMGRPNELDGVDFERVKVKEVSLVGVGCCSSARIEGRAKCACKKAKAPDAVTTPAAVGPHAEGHAAAPGALTISPMDTSELHAEIAKTLKAFDWTQVFSKAFPPQSDPDTEAAMDCPQCGNSMKKGGKCPECGYVDKADASLKTKVHNPKVEKRGEKWAVVDDDGKVYGTHDSEEKAKAQVAALNADKGDGDVHTKAGRVFSAPNEAAMREIASMLEASLANMRALLSRVEESPQPEGEANYPNVLDPTRKALTLVKPTEATKITKKVLILTPPSEEYMRRQKMMSTGRLD